MSFVTKLFVRKRVKNLPTDEDRKAIGRDYTWPVPYLSRIEGTTLQPGQSIIVRGYIIASNRFSIRLATGSKLEGNENCDDVVLGIENRIGEKRISINSIKDETPGKAVRYRHPFKVGEEFDYRIRAHEQHFEIIVNHKILCIFPHRQPLANISHIYVTGDVELYTVSWEGKYYAIPYQAGIPGNFYPGRKLYVSGQIGKAAKNFTINLHAANDIALNFSARFKEKKVMRNSQTSGTWGNAEKEGPKFPFSQKTSFDIVIVCEEDALLCYMDGKLTYSFKHRLSPQNIDKLSIDGNVDLQGVHLK